MVDISAVNVVKAFEQKKNVLDGLSFEVYEGEHVGLLGMNGAGKTTLLRILTREIESDSGDIVIAAGKRTGLISQIPVYPGGFTVEDVLRKAFGRQIELRRKMLLMEERMSSGDTGSSTVRLYGELAAQFEHLEGYDIEVEINKMCGGLGISAAMRERLFSSLSGGETTRINLARLLLEKTDILLLDEPTNHLDISGVEWLEEYLRTFAGTVLTVSHDRYFLDRVVTRVIEIEKGRACSYKGNYTQYTEAKRAEAELQSRQYEKEQTKIRQLRYTAERMHGWGLQNSKLMRRSQAIEKRIERMTTAAKPEREKEMRARFRAKEFRGDEALIIEGVKKSYGEKVLFHDIDLLVCGGERIGLIGENGAGKTTLLRMIMSLERPDSGSITLGPAIKAAYLPQKVNFPIPSMTLVDTVISALSCSAQTARNRLGAYQFRGEDVFKVVAELSGGEKSRLALCILMDDDVNLLILDEPTNHLDVPSRTWIESAVEDYDGTLIFVSHDRYFINRFAGRIWALEKGNVIDITGGYDIYTDIKRQETASGQPRSESKKKRKKPYDIKKELRQKLLAAEREIAAAEAAVNETDADIQRFSSDYEKLTELYETREEQQRVLSDLMSVWEKLGAELECAEEE